jgi:hypothetical protein
MAESSLASETIFCRDEPPLRGCTARCDLQLRRGREGCESTILKAALSSFSAGTSRSTGSSARSAAGGGCAVGKLGTDEG